MCALLKTQVGSIHSLAYPSRSPCGLGNQMPSIGAVWEIHFQILAYLPCGRFAQSVVSAQRTPGHHVALFDSWNRTLSWGIWLAGSASAGQSARGSKQVWSSVLILGVLHNYHREAAGNCAKKEGELCEARSLSWLSQPGSRWNVLDPLLQNRAVVMRSWVNFGRWLMCRRWRSSRRLGLTYEGGRNQP
jgi:hypothetical protein